MFIRIAIYDVCAVDPIYRSNLIEAVLDLLGYLAFIDLTVKLFFRICFCKQLVC